MSALTVMDEPALQEFDAALDATYFLEGSNGGTITSTKRQIVP